MLRFLCVLGAASAALAQPAPKLDSLSATWFQRGTTNEVTLKGDAFWGVEAVIECCWPMVLRLWVWRY